MRLSFVADEAAYKPTASGGAPALDNAIKKFYLKRQVSSARRHSNLFSPGMISVLRVGSISRREAPVQITRVHLIGDSAFSTNRFDVA